MQITHVRGLCNQKGVILILNYLDCQGASNVTKLKIELMHKIAQPTIYRAIQVLLKYKLIKEEHSGHPTERIFKLTNKGKQVLAKLLEINTLLEKE